MQDKAILDTSIIAAIFFKEELSEKVENKVSEYQKLITVDISLAELTNVACKRVEIFGESKEICFKSLEKSIEFATKVCEILNTDMLYKNAFKIAIENKISAYDSLFIAASQIKKTPLLTLDKKLGRIGEKADIEVQIID